MTGCAHAAVLPAQLLSSWAEKALETLPVGDRTRTGPHAAMVFVSTAKSRVHDTLVVSLSVPLSPSPSRARARSLSGCACRWRRASRRHTASQGSMAQVGVFCACGGWDGMWHRQRLAANATPRSDMAVRVKKSKTLYPLEQFHLLSFFLLVCHIIVVLSSML